MIGPIPVQQPGASTRANLIMLRHTSSTAFLLAGLLVIAPAAHPDDWTTVGSDAQRSSWVRSDAKTSPSSVRAPDFRFLWKIDLPNEPRGENALTAPALLDFLISHRGFRSLAFVGGSSGGVYAMDTDLARMEWERHFLPGPGSDSPDCPGGMTANLTRPTAAAMPSSLGFGARGRRSPAKSGVGSPGAGAVTLSEARPAPSPAARRPATARTRPPARRALRGVTLVYALSADGLLHTLYVSNGRDHTPPMPFLPANANARGLIVVDDVAYVATGNSCNDVQDGVWALDLASGSVATWESDGGSVVGPTGIAISPDGTVFATTREGSLVALESRTLALKQAAGAEGFRSAPVVFDHQGEDRIAAIAGDGSLRVYAGGTLEEIASGAPDGAGGPLDSSLAAWRDSSGTHWILAPGPDRLTAWKLSQDGDTTTLEQGWQSPTMDAPLPPVVVNGVVFALDGGSAAGAAKLFAIEGTSGRELWNSVDSIATAARGHALSSGPGHVFVTTADSSVLAFGFPMEH